MDSNFYSPPFGEVKIVKCKQCGSDVPVNAAYPIDSVDSCKYCPPKNDKNV